MGTVAEHAQGLVDPVVSRAKFAREVERFLAIGEAHRRRGCWLAKAEFPDVFVVFATDKTQPGSVAFGARLDFSNYDIVPPSVRLANPFTWEPLKAKEAPHPFPRLKRVPVPAEIAAAQPEAEEGFQVQALLQSYGPEELPFLCLQGVREYHDHPLHSDDPWLAHRTEGCGTLNHLVEQLWTYGVKPLSGWHLQIQVGFQHGGPTE